MIGPVTGVGIAVFGAFVGLISVSFFIDIEFKKIGTIKVITDAKKEWRHSANTLLVFGCLQTLFGQIGVLILGWLSDSADAGVFAVTARIADLTQFPLVALNVVAAPTIARLHAEGDKAALQSMVTATARWVALAAFCISVPFLISPEFFLNLFGPGFGVGADTLRIVLIGQLLQATAGSVNNLLIMSGNHRTGTVLLATAVIGNILLAVILMPSFGIEGVGLARAVAVTGLTISATYFAWKRLGIVPSVFGIRN
jgi:O-antigen/teichoic acid export membrane protein